ncbi:MAG: hypothetical protein E6R04_00020 [Spirochaetes bacterium]|nr:MAG: hypothetical protein E6R04_00020 [Spirochaetota bacterium]
MPVLWVTPEELEDDASSPYAYEACKTASYILWAFSGRKYHGIRTVTERYECPCSTPLVSRTYLSTPSIVGGAMINTPTGSTSDSCGCSGTIAGRHARLRLRGTPVRSVQKVSRNGVEIPSDNYKIVNGSILQLVGSVQDVCGLEVTYSYGVVVPMAGRLAARKLAGEMSKGWSGQDCALPDRVTSVSRQGFSFTVLDKQDFLEEGRTGIYEVDLFLRASNPDKARKKSKVFSPDLPKAYRVSAGNTLKVIGPNDIVVTPGQVASWSVSMSSNGLEGISRGDWNPQGQITSWNGAVLLEFDPARFEIDGDTLTVNLTPDETASISGTTASWDLYGISTSDGYTLIHMMSSTIYIGGQ